VVSACAVGVGPRLRAVRLRWRGIA